MSSSTSGPRSPAMGNPSDVTRSPWELSSEQKLSLAIGIIGTAIVGISWATGANLTDVCIAEGSILAMVAALLLCHYFMRKTETQSTGVAGSGTQDTAGVTLPPEITALLDASFVASGASAPEDEVDCEGDDAEKREEVGEGDEAATAPAATASAQAAESAEATATAATAPVTSTEATATAAS